MKTTILCIMLSLVVSPTAIADDLKVKGSIAPDAIRGENHYLILNKGGNEMRMIRPDPVRGSGHWIIETKD